MNALALFAVLALCAPPAPRYTVLAADRGTGQIALVEPDGTVSWKYETKHDIHDLHRLPNGNILTHTSHTKVVEINPAKEIVWSYESKPVSGGAGRVEVHAFQRLSDGNTMIAESGNARIIEVNPAGTIVKTVKLNVPRPDAHRDTRMVRKLSSGNYLVCHEGQGLVREYDGDGKTIWEYQLNLGNRPRRPGHGVEGHGIEVYGAVRLPNGNTLIAGGNNNRVLEVNPAKEIVWQLDQKEIPGVTIAWVTTLQVLPSGNILIGNCHAGKENPQLIEVTREKKLVWSFKDWTNFGDNTASALIVGVDGVIR
ncbi:MAG: hypothetical protein ACRCZF_05995 [Gemmataceae bacterium]